MAELSCGPENGLPRPSALGALGTFMSAVLVSVLLADGCTIAMAPFRWLSESEGETGAE